MAYRITNIKTDTSYVVADHEFEILKEKGHLGKFTVEAIPEVERNKPFIPEAVRHLHKPETAMVEEAVASAPEDQQKQTGQGRKAKVSA